MVVVMVAQVVLLYDQEDIGAERQEFLWLPFLHIYQELLLTMRVAMVANSFCPIW